MPHLLASTPSRMIFEHLRNYFHFKVKTSGFPQLFQFCFHIAQGHIPPQITHILKATHLLTMTKPSNGIHSITMGETLYRLTSHALCLQFREDFATFFSPHPFKIVTKGGCETIIHDIRCTLDLHLD